MYIPDWEAHLGDEESLMNFKKVVAAAHLFKKFNLDKEWNNILEFREGSLISVSVCWRLKDIKAAMKP